MVWLWPALRSGLHSWHSNTALGQSRRGVVTIFEVISFTEAAYLEMEKLVTKWFSMMKTVQICEIQKQKDKIILVQASNTTRYLN